MQKVFKEEQIDVVSNKLNLPRTVVKSAVECYLDVLKDELAKGHSVKVFNICYLQVRGDTSERPRMTLAYISSEIGKALALGGITVQRILSSFESRVVLDLQQGLGFTLRGLCRIQTVVENGSTRLRIQKATCYNSAPVYVSTLGSFRRRVLSGG